MECEHAGVRALTKEDKCQVRQINQAKLMASQKKHRYCIPYTIFAIVGQRLGCVPCPSTTLARLFRCTMFAHDTLIQSEIEMQVIANLQNTVPGDPPPRRAIIQQRRCETSGQLP